MYEWRYFCALQSQLSASMGFKRNQLSTAGATDCHGGHRRDRSVGVPRGLQGGGGGGSGVSRMGWGAYGGSGRFKGGGRGSENSVVECKMCNEGVDGRDFLNLTVDEMMHIRQVSCFNVFNTLIFFYFRVFTKM